MAITLVILVQIVSRWMGYIVPSTDDLSGFFLAASSFLGLAYTLKKGGHIRVSLVIQRLSRVQRHRQEFLVLAVGSACACACVCACACACEYSFKSTGADECMSEACLCAGLHTFVRV